MGRSYWLEGDLDTRLAWLERSVSLCPNYAQGIYACALTEALGGLRADGGRHVEQAMRLSPIDPLYCAFLGTRGLCHWPWATTLRPRSGRIGPRTRPAPT